MGAAREVDGCRACRLGGAGANGLGSERGGPGGDGVGPGPGGRVLGPPIQKVCRLGEGVRDGADAGVRDTARPGPGATAAAARARRPASRVAGGRRSRRRPALDLGLCGRLKEALEAGRRRGPSRAAASA